MRSPKAALPRIVWLSHRVVIAGTLALLVAACSTSAATPSVAPTASPDVSVPPTPIVIYVTPTPAPTDTPAATPTVAPTAPPVVTAPPYTYTTHPPAGKEAADAR